MRFLFGQVWCTRRRAARRPVTAVAVAGRLPLAPYVGSRLGAQDHFSVDCAVPRPARSEFGRENLDHPVGELGTQLGRTSGGPGEDPYRGVGRRRGNLLRTHLESRADDEIRSGVGDAVDDLDATGAMRIADPPGPRPTDVLAVDVHA